MIFSRKERKELKGKRIFRPLRLLRPIQKEFDQGTEKNR
jgi:hypothetical protein